MVTKKFTIYQKGNTIFSKSVECNNSFTKWDITVQINSDGLIEKIVKVMFVKGIDKDDITERLENRTQEFWDCWRK